MRGRGREAADRARRRPNEPDNRRRQRPLAICISIPGTTRLAGDSAQHPMLDLLLAAKADPNAQSGEGGGHQPSMLVTALEAGAAWAVKPLITAGANVEERGSTFGSTASEPRARRPSGLWKRCRRSSRSVRGNESPESSSTVRRPKHVGMHPGRLRPHAGRRSTAPHTWGYTAVFSRTQGTADQGEAARGPGTAHSPNSGVCATRGPERSKIVIIRNRWLVLRTMPMTPTTDHSERR